MREHYLTSLNIGTFIFRTIDISDIYIYLYTDFDYLQDQPLVLHRLPSGQLVFLSFYVMLYVHVSPDSLAMCGCGQPSAIFVQ